MLLLYNYIIIIVTNMCPLETIMNCLRVFGYCIVSDSNIWKKNKYVAIWFCNSKNIYYKN